MSFSGTVPCKPFLYFMRILHRTPSAVAEIKGSSAYPAITGKVSFFQTDLGVLVSAQVWGLPTSSKSCENSSFLAFHIHGGDSCTGNVDDSFANAGTHYNPADCEHPYHAGDLVPLLTNNGYAFEIFLTNRFSVTEVIGKTIVIHLGPDDFSTQPSGNAGEKIACGVIARCRTRQSPHGCCFSKTP